MTTDPQLFDHLAKVRDAFGRTSSTLTQVLDTFDDIDGNIRPEILEHKTRDEILDDLVDLAHRMSDTYDGAADALIDMIDGQHPTIVSGLQRSKRDIRATLRRIDARHTGRDIDDGDALEQAAAVFDEMAERNVDGLRSIIADSLDTIVHQIHHHDDTADDAATIYAIDIDAPQERGEKMVVGVTIERIATASRPGDLIGDLDLAQQIGENTTALAIVITTPDRLEHDDGRLENVRTSIAAHPFGVTAYIENDDGSLEHEHVAGEWRHREHEPEIESIAANARTFYERVIIARAAADRD
jgi:hypothetical protein